MATIKVIDKEFEVTIPEETILKAIDRIAGEINRDMKDKNPLFVCVLNGAFMFAADLMKRITVPCEISFVKVASYKGTSTTGAVKQLIGFNEQVEGRTVIVLEDIVDTGNTMEMIIADIRGHKPAEVKIATMLFKPEAYTKSIPVDYVGLDIPNEFIIGYGLDYNGQARNLKDIYTLCK